MRKEESGFALVTVLVAFAALILLTIAITDYALGSQTVSKHDQDWNAALAAAQAGADDYLYQLNNTASYWLYGPSNLPPGGNAAFTGWVDVPGATTGHPQFRYDVDSTVNSKSFFSSGSVTVKASGKVGKVVRTVEVTYRLRSFVDFLYFTDLETSDPKVVSGQPTTCGKTTSGPQRYRYSYQAGGSTVAAYSSSCNQIRFVSGDVVNGPVHSNDRVYVCGTPTFKGDASTTYPGAVTANPPSSTLWAGDSGCSPNNPSFQGQYNKMFWEAKLTPPDSNTSLACYADPTRSGCTGIPTELRTGCLYTGPTYVNFRSDGTMDVYSPYTRKTYNGCRTGTGITPAAAFNGVIYVQAIPSSSSDPNYTSWSGTGGKCNAPSSVTSPLVAQPLLDTTNKTPLGLPRANEQLGYGFSYPCNNGDALVQGTVKGQYTIGTANNVIMTGPLVYHDKTVGSSSYQGNDLLGLIANGFVEVYHPICSSSCGGSSNNGNEYTSNGSLAMPGLGSNSWPPKALVNPEFDAALFAVNDSVLVQSWDAGDTNRLGTGSNAGVFTVFGTIAQENRGAVGTGSGSSPTTGYLKSYNYDSRLRYLEPPYFLNPSSQPTFSARTFKELLAAYSH